MWRCSSAAQRSSVSHTSSSPVGSVVCTKWGASSSDQWTGSSTMSLPPERTL
jgi:hypothetical protein